MLCLGGTTAWFCFYSLSLDKHAEIFTVEIMSEICFEII